MGEDRYPFALDESTGRAYVEVTGDICARKIRNTFAAVALNKRWPAGDRSVLWRAETALFPAGFAFQDILKNTPITRALSRPGRSAIVVAKNADMLEKVARFYQSIGTTSNRHIEIFFNAEEASAWLDQERS